MEEKTIFSFVYMYYFNIKNEQTYNKYNEWIDKSVTCSFPYRKEKKEIKPHELNKIKKASEKRQLWEQWTPYSSEERWYFSAAISVL